MSKCYINDNFFEFLIRKEIPFEALEEDFHNFSGEDSFNSDIAEKALDIACELYPEKPGEDEDDTIDQRHEFVSEFLEFARCEVVKKWAENLGMITKEQAITRGNLQASEAVKYHKDKHDKELNLARERCYNDGIDDGTRMTLHKFSKMSAYAFSKWKLERFDPNVAEGTKTIRVPQDSEDEAWEQLMAFQKANFKDV